MAAEDRVFAERQAEIVADAVPQFVSPPFWVNPPASRRDANNKPLQLQAALASCLTIPETIISNDPSEIRNFVKYSGRVIHKPLQPAAWVGSKGEYLTFTSIVSLDDIDDAGDTLSLSPGIFQTYVEKAFEVRVVFMGDQAFAAKIDARNKGESMIDWRLAYLYGSGLPIEPISLPREVHDRCRDLMSRLGLVFGCFDFCVQPDGHYVFLEVNPMGQFLWMDRHPAFALLSAFCDFLQSQDPNFQLPKGPSDDFRFADVSQTNLYQALWSQQGHRRSASEPDPFTYAEPEMETAG